MPTRSAHPCGQVGCGKLVKGSPRCSEHTRAAEVARGSSTDRGYDGEWRRERALWLKAHPACAKCPAPATVVDHIVPHRGDQDLFWDVSNWQSLCARCHGIKTAAETLHPRRG